RPQRQAKAQEGRQPQRQRAPAAPPPGRPRPPRARRERRSLHYLSTHRLDLPLHDITLACSWCPPTLTVLPDFTVIASPQGQTVTRPTSTTYTVRLGSLNGYSRSVPECHNALVSQSRMTSQAPPRLHPTGLRHHLHQSVLYCIL